MYQVDKEVINAVLQYLSTKPYKETFQLIAELQKGKLIEPEKGDDPSPE